MALLDFKKKETNEKMTDSGTVPFNFKFILIQKLIRREVCFFYRYSKICVLLKDKVLIRMVGKLSER